MKLVRKGNVYQAYISNSDFFGRRHWIPIGDPFTMKMQGSDYIGFALSGPGNDTEAKVTLTDITVYYEGEE